MNALGDSFIFSVLLPRERTMEQSFRINNFLTEKNGVDILP